MENMNMESMNMESTNMECMDMESMNRGMPYGERRDRMNIQYRLAEQSDVDRVAALASQAAIRMSEQGIGQWDTLYPIREDFQQDILMGQLTVGVAEGKIVVFYTVNEECDPEYQEAKWKKPEKPHCILHRLCVNPHFQHQGIARQAMEHIQRQAVEKGYQAIRLDVFSKNPHTLKLYLGCGFEKVGSVRWRKGVFYLMEKYIIV